MSGHGGHLEVGSVALEVTFESVDWNALGWSRPLLEVLAAESFSDGEGNGWLLSDHHDCARTLDMLGLGTLGEVLEGDLVVGTWLAGLAAVVLGA